MSSAPIQPDHRIQYLDVLRGFAITGVLLAYVFWAVGPAPSSIYTSFDNIINQAGYFLIDSKCYTILASLFTAGFVLHMNKSADEARSLYIYRRRLLGLLIIGVFHALLLRNGDILIPYAILTFIASLFYKSSNRTIIIVMIIVFLAQAELPQLWRGLGLSFAQRPSGHQGNYWVQNFAWVKFWYSIAIFFWETTLLLLFAGLLVGKIFIQKRKKLSNRQLVIIATAGFIGGGLSYVIETFYPSKIEALPDIGNTYVIRAIPYYLLDLVHKIGIASAYASILFLLARNFRLSILANMGRMSLTNYIMEAVIVVPFCLSFNLLDHITPTIALVMAAVIWIMQALFSSWWLKHHQFGPLEWLLRRFTYGKTLTREKREQAEWIPATVMIEK